jgi:hypothetical protein
MTWTSFLNLLRGKKAPRSARFRRPYLEELETRTLLSGDSYLLTTVPSLAAGSPLLVEIQAMNAGGLDTTYAGTAQVTSTDPLVGPRAISFSRGLGLLGTTLKTFGSWTFTATDTADSTITGISNPIQVSAGPPVKLAFATQPADTATGHPLLEVTVQIEDPYGNLVAGDNSDSVTVSVTSGPGSFTSTSTVTASVQSGVATFSNLALVVPGIYTLGAIVQERFTGPSSSSFTVSPLQVVPGSFMGSPSGFSLQFNAPYLVNPTTPVLFGHGFGVTAPFPSVTLTQTKDESGNTVHNPVEGSLVLDPASNGITFVPTSTALLDSIGTPVLADGTYTVDIAASAAHDGFQALYNGGGFLDGLRSGTPGSGDYLATFTVGAAAAHDDLLWVPPTAEGPGQALDAPGMNQVGGGYPIYLSDTTGNVTDVQVTFNYNPGLLTVTGVTGAGVALLGSTKAGQAVLHYSGPALPAGSRTPIGYLIATVPSGTAANPMPYKAEDLLHLSSVTLNGGTIPVATSDAVHLLAYVGDADGSGSYNSNDAVLITRALLNTDSGLTAYPVVDPALVADTDGAGFIPADAGLQANEAGTGFPTPNLPIPPVPVGVHFVTLPAVPPVTLFTPSFGTVTAINPTVSGRIDVSVAALQAQVDSGSTFPVAFDALGNFSFATALLLDGSADGVHTVSLQTIDKAGNALGTASLSFTLLTITKLATPTLDPASDSGPSNRDGITNVTTPIIHATAPSGLYVVFVVDGQPKPPISSSGGVATITLTPLADGVHNITAGLEEYPGSSLIDSSDPLTLTIKTTAPKAPSFDLAAGTADLGPETTSAGRVTLIGQSDPGVTLALVGTPLSALASGSGVFQIPGVALAMGANTLTVRATDLAGNTSSASLTVTRGAPGGPNAVIVWNQAILSAIQLDATDPPHASRALAMVQSAVYDAVSAIAGTPSYYVKLAAPAGASVEAAVDEAAYTVLCYLYPAQQPSFNTLLGNRLGLVPDGQAKIDGMTVGQAAGNALIALRANDGWNTFVDFVPQSGPGQWQPTPPAYAEALDPQWAALVPFAMTGPSQFRPAGPPALDSSAWADAVNQVMSLGSSANATSTDPVVQGHVQIAHFWADGLGTVTPPGQWNRIAENLAQAQGDSLAADARLFAELDVALGDAAIVAWDAKYTYTTWRPITVIQSGGDGVNPSVTANPTWTSLLVTPNFPEYISGHSTFSAAAAAVLDSYFGSNVGFTDTSAGITRSFTNFDTAAAEAGLSRIYGGIHFLFSDLDALAAGQALGNYVVRTFTVTADTQPPKVSITAPASGTTAAANTTITGQVIDNLSGVAKLEVQIDGGAYAPLAFDGHSNFTLPTTFATNGSADGLHQFFFRGTDVAGNVSTPVELDFTLDTQLPAVTITAPTVGATLTAGAVLTGTASGSGSALTALTFDIDSGTAVTLPYDAASGAFTQALGLSGLAAGSHTLSVAARDTAGNTSTTSVTVMLTAAPPVTVASYLPSNGASDIGLTYRPKVVFSAPIDPTSLSASDFYATDATGTAVPATIVPSDDGTYAWLFFTNPLPGASMITVTVDGSGIHAASGATIDAADTGTPGSKLTFSFTTVSESFVPGTTITGIVADPGPDLMPGTPDDVAAGPDGVLMTGDDVYKLPIANAKVYILGHEDQAVYSDSQGNFTLTNVPVGDVKLGIDGRTATNAPTGYYFPEMVMDLIILPGIANTVMGSMGSTQQKNASAAVQGVYLPRVLSSILQTVSSTHLTEIGVSPQAGPDLTPQQQSELKIEVAPGSLVGMDGTRMSTGQVGISTVPPQLVMDMLPPGLLQHTFDITIQAPGVATFSTPATMTFPNVFHAAPGTQVNFLSFDHTTGRLVIDGTATVSADGLTATTDPGFGITHPGWHGLTPPGSPSDPPCPPSPHDKMVDPVPVYFGIKDYFFSTDTGSFKFSIGNGAMTLDPNSGPCSDTNIQATPLDVTIAIDSFDIDKQFLMGLPREKFQLEPGQVHTDTVSLVKLIDSAIKAKGIGMDQFYGIRVDIHGYKDDGTNNPGGADLINKHFYVYRFVDAADADSQDQFADFAQTLAVPAASVTRQRPIQYKMGPKSMPELSNSDYTNFPKQYPGNFAFAPTVVMKAKDLTATVQITDPDGMMVSGPQMLKLRGEGTPQFTLDVNTAELKTVLKTMAGADPAAAYVAGTNPVLFTQNERTMIRGNVDAIATAVFKGITNLYAPFAAGIKVVDVGGTGVANSITIGWKIGMTPGSFGNSGPSVGGDGVDNSAKEIAVATNYMNNSDARNAFLLSQAINQNYTTKIEAYPNAIIQWSYNPTGANVTYTDLEMSEAEFVNALVKDAAHEAGHTLGAVHTAAWTTLTGALNEVQTITTSGPGPAFFRLDYNGATTGDIEYGASDADVLAELVVLPNLGPNVTVTSAAGGPNQTIYTLKFYGDLAATDVPQVMGKPPTSGFDANAVGATTTQGETGRDAGKDLVLAGTDGKTDIMMGGGDLNVDGTQAFQSDLSMELLLVSVKMGYTPAQGKTVLDFLVAWNTAGAFNSFPEATIPRPPDPHLSVTTAGGQLVTDTLDLGTVPVDGAGGMTSQVTLTLSNFGGADLILNSVYVAATSGNFLVTAIPGGTVLHPGDSQPITVTFDPLSSGPLTGNLVVNTNDPNGPATIPLSGFGLSPNAHLEITVPDNDFGGAMIGSAGASVSTFATIGNDGSLPLTITGINPTDPQFAVDATASLASPANPLVIPPGKTFSFDATFRDSSVGLQRGAIRILTSDPLAPIYTLYVDGTGLPASGTALHYAMDYVALENLDLPGAPVLRQQSDAKGNWSFFLAPNTDYHYVIFDPVSGLVAHGYFSSGPSGQKTMPPTPVFLASTQNDTDGDGLPDDVETAIGTSLTKTDTDGDGIDDFTAVKQGLDPLGGHAVITGVIASLPLQGEANAVVVTGSPLNAGGQTAFVATGSYGLAIVDVTQFQKPILLAQLAIPGDGTGVAVDLKLNIAAVADNGGGLNFVDISNLMQPSLLRHIGVSAAQVRVKSGVAYAAVGSDVQAYDLLTGEELDSLSVGANPITGLALDGSFLYTMDTGASLQVIDISGLFMVARGAVSLPAGRGKLFVGNGIAFIAAESLFPPFPGGFATADVSNPNAPRLLGGVQTTSVAGTGLAANGSGLLITVGQPGRTNAIDVLNVSDPTNTGSFLTRFLTDQEPVDVAIGEGIAFVAEGTAGLQVANYLAFDTKGLAPMATISLPASAVVGMNGSTPQVVEGSRLPILANISDDVQASNVELLVNGKVVQNAVAFPFDLATLLPTIAANGSDSLRLQVQAVDTGGNIGLSNVITVQLVRDTVRPVLLSSTITEGAKRGQTFRSIALQFSKPLDPATVNATTMKLTGPAGLVAPTNIQFRADGAIVTLTYPTLSAGNYQFVIHAASVADIPGNFLGTTDLVTNFTIAHFSINWINGDGGYWDDPTNWDTGTVPTATDDVYIFAASRAPVIFQTGSVTVSSLTVNSPFSISGGTLTLTNASSIAAPFALSGGTLNGTGTVSVTDALTWTLGSMAGSGMTVVTPTGKLFLTSNGTVGLGRALETDGPTSWTGNVSVSMTAATWTNNSTVTANSTLPLAAYGLGGTNAFVNNGTFTQQGTGTTLFTTSVTGVAFTNAGVLNVNAGTLQIAAGGSSSGSVTLSGGSLKLTGGTFTLVDGSSITGTSALQISGGTLAVPGTSIVANLTFASGTLNGAGTLTIGNTLTWTGGTMAGTGKTLVPSGSSLALGGLSTVSLNRALETDGPTSWTGSVFVQMNAGTWTNNGAVTANSTSTLEAYGGSGGTTNTFVNNGSFTQQGTGTTLFTTVASGVAFNNAGTVTVNAGTLNLNASGTHSGTFTLTGGVTLSLNGTHTIDSTSTSAVSGIGTVAVVGGTTTITSLLSTTAALSLSGGTLTANATLTVGNLTMSNGTLNGTGTVTVSGSLTWTGGTMAGTGLTVVAATGTLGLGGTGTVGLNRTLETDGPTSWTGSVFVNMNSGTWNNNSAVSANSSSTLEAYGSGGINTIVNNGTFTKQGTGTVLFTNFMTGVAFNNAGTVNVNAGTLGLTSPGTNNGAITAAAGATLNISGNFSQAAAGSLTVQIGGTASTQFGHITITGSATLAGTLNIVLVSGFVPTSGQTFQVMTWSSEAGMFSTINNPLGVMFTVTFDPHDLKLTAV